MVNLKLAQDLDSGHKVFFEEDISIYMCWDFVPLYDVEGTTVIALYKITDEIIQYIENHYKNFQLLYSSRKNVHDILYRRLHQDYNHLYSAHSIDYRLLIILIIGVFCLGGSALLINCLYLVGNLFKLITILLAAFRKRPQEDIRVYTDLPIYTVLVPIRNEKEETIEALMKSLSDLDYPSDRLDIKLIVEEGDIQLVEAINKNFEVIKVPYSLPQTKAKACNYALRFARGHYVTIYDADDQPHPLQLQKVVAVFRNNNHIACVQAPLNYYNYNANYLTRFFALEYSYLFDFALHGTNKLKFPILLGGSSNHFRIEVLRELNGWDPYNVTEDADIGIKLKRQGKLVYILSTHETLEEAPIKVSSWIKQRSRWIKGFITTYLVHAKFSIKLIREAGLLSLLGMQLLILMPITIYIYSPLLWIKFFMSIHECQYFFLINIILYLAINILTGLLSMKLRKLWRLIPYMIFMPLYYILHSLASYRALWQLFVNPYKWDKTEHYQKR